MKFRVFVTNIYLQSRMKYTRDEKKNGTGAQRNQSSIRKQKEGRESGKKFSIPCLIEWHGVKRVKHERRPLPQLSLWSRWLSCIIIGYFSAIALCQNQRRLIWKWCHFLNVIKAQRLIKENKDSFKDSLAIAEPAAMCFVNMLPSV